MDTEVLQKSYLPCLSPHTRIQVCMCVSVCVCVCVCFPCGRITSQFANCNCTPVGNCSLYIGRTYKQARRYTGNSPSMFTCRSSCCLFVLTLIPNQNGNIDTHPHAHTHTHTHTHIQSAAPESETFLPRLFQIE